jgi:hypothetical protein
LEVENRKSFRTTQSLLRNEAIVANCLADVMHRELRRTLVNPKRRAISRILKIEINEAGFGTMFRCRTLLIMIGLGREIVRTGALYPCESWPIAAPNEAVMDWERTSAVRLA